MAKLLSGTRIYGTATIDTQLSINGGLATSSTASGSLQVVGGVGISGGLFVGGTITATNFVGAFSGTITGTSSTASQVQTLLQTNNASYYPTFVNANNASVVGMSMYTTSSFTVNPATGYIGVGTPSTARKLEVLDSVNPQLRLTQTSGSLYTDFQTDASGNLNISPAGGRVILPTPGGYLDMGAGTILLGSNGFAGGGDIVFRSAGAASTVISPVFRIKDSTAALQDGLRFSPTWINSTPGSLNVNVSTSVLGFTITNISVNSTGTISTTFLSTATSTSTTTGALVVAGGVGITGSVFIGGTATVVSTLASTSSVQNNALYVAGGVGIATSLLVTGPAVFQNSVTFSGTSTYIYSTNTVYTDNLIELHSPGGSTSTWTVDDGKDVGLRLHYYANGADQNAALVLANDTKYLEWYSTGTESTTSTFVNASYGTFKTGSIILANTATSTSTAAGALVVAGSVGVGGNINFGGNLYQNGVLFAGGTLAPTTIKTSVYTAVAGDLVRVNSAGGTFTVNLPAAPVDGNQVGIFDIYGNCGTVPILIGANTKLIEGDATGVSLNIAGAYVVFLYNSVTASWKAEVVPSVNATSISTATSSAPLVLNDISTQFDGSKTVFALRQDQTSINTIVDSKDLDVAINGQRLAPYVDTLSYPWLTPYDSFRGFRVSGSNLIIYTAPPIGGTVSLILRQASTSRQKKKYPYSATTIAFGD